jgi:hypothetical protein
LPGSIIPKNLVAISSAKPLRHPCLQGREDAR